MRRRDREITDMNRIAQILSRAQAASIAFAGETPYVIPMNYGFAQADGRFTLYLHGANAGEKIERIKADPRAAFTVFTDNRVYSVGEECTSSFDSVCGEGTIRFLEGEEKIAALCALMAHYGKAQTTFPAQMLAATCVMALDVERISGKHHD